MYADVKTNKNIYEDDSKWCNCDVPEDDEYFGNNAPESKEIGKHHWRCTGCNKITQIG